MVFVTLRKICIINILPGFCLTQKLDADLRMICLVLPLLSGVIPMRHPSAGAHLDYMMGYDLAFPLLSRSSMSLAGMRSSWSLFSEFWALAVPR